MTDETKPADVVFGVRVDMESVLQRDGIARRIEAIPRDPDEPPNVLMVFGNADRRFLLTLLAARDAENAALRAEVERLTQVATDYHAMYEDMMAERDGLEADSDAAWAEKIERLRMDADDRRDYINGLHVDILDLERSLAHAQSRRRTALLELWHVVTCWCGVVGGNGTAVNAAYERLRDRRLDRKGEW